jgi:hypothetical protein
MMRVIVKMNKNNNYLAYNKNHKINQTNYLKNNNKKSNKYHRKNNEIIFINCVFIISLLYDINQFFLT